VNVGDHDAFIERAVASYSEDGGGVDPLAVAGVYDELAELASAAGHPGQSEQHRRRALTCRVAVLGAEHPEVVVTEAILAVTLVELGRDEEAEILLRRTLELFEATPAPDSEEMAIAAHRLAGVMARRNDAAAVRLYEQALGISRRLLGAGHPRVATILHDLALLYDRTGREEEAGRLRAEARAILESENQGLRPGRARERLLPMP
jgi:tetratricopeptide (TPR) repeat protein